MSGQVARNIAPPARPAPGGDNWIVSETTSPVAIRRSLPTTFSRGGSDSAPMQTLHHCRGGRTELVSQASCPPAVVGINIPIASITDQPLSTSSAELAIVPGSGVAFHGAMCVRFVCNRFPKRGTSPFAFHRADAAKAGIFATAD